MWLLRWRKEGCVVVYVSGCKIIEVEEGRVCGCRATRGSLCLIAAVVGSLDQVFYARNSDPTMENFNQYFVYTKDGVIGGYRSLMVLQPELKLGIFFVMSTGGAGYGPASMVTLVGSAVHTLGVALTVLLAWR